MKQPFFILLCAAAAVFCIPQAASACSCVPQSESEYIENADIAFSGKVVSITKVPFKYQYEVAFEVFEAYKGLSGKSVIIYTEKSKAACGYEFKAGQIYSVNAYLEGEGLFTNLCSGNKELSDTYVVTEIRAEEGVIPVTPPAILTGPPK